MWIRKTPVVVNGKTIVLDICDIDRTNPTVGWVFPNGRRMRAVQKESTWIAELCWTPIA